MKSNHSAAQIATMTAFFLFLATSVCGQKNPVYENLPVGKYPVGFKIFTLTDDSRIVKPENNYLGEKNEDDRRKKLPYIFGTLRNQIRERKKYALRIIAIIICLKLPMKPLITVRKKIR